jgi:putative pyruvate formate lyase activating enzyme
MTRPSYIDAFKSGLLEERARAAVKSLEECRLCPRQCGVNRLKGKKGLCETGARAIVCSYFGHHGEEPPVSGTQGSGTIFFSRCTLKCVYCQNYEFSQLGEGREVGPEELAGFMLKLQSEGCHNINFVTPTHVMPQILEALVLAAEKGLRIPLVYNTSGYERPEILKTLAGLIDIYLPDMRYADETAARRFSSAADYPRFNRASVREMFCQVGPAKYDDRGTAVRGLIVRHLVLPGGLAGTEKILAFIAEKLSREVPVSLMSQYFPAFKAEKTPPLDRRITLEEYEEAVNLMQKYGLDRGWVQESGGLKRLAGIHIKKNI